jgi:hypothetical protein
MSEREERDRGVADCPVYWFTLLELGRVYGDFLQAERARGELRRLGVRVEYGPAGLNENNTHVSGGCDER